MKAGNGSAMRAAPATPRSLEEVLRIAKETAELTHNHPEGHRLWAVAGHSSPAKRLDGDEASCKREIKDLQKHYGYDMQRAVAKSVPPMP